MKVKNRNFQSIWLDEKDPGIVHVIDQLKLPFEFRIADLRTFADAVEAISGMMVRGAPLIGVTAAFGIYLALLENPGADDMYIRECAARITGARPTAINPYHTVARSVRTILAEKTPAGRVEAALSTALEMCKEETESCRMIGQHGLPLINKLGKEKRGKPVNLLTHCNAGWLACIDYGTATAPIYLAHDSGIPVHVWIDETRPRNQGARLTAWELAQHGVPHTLITDNAGGMLMQQGKVDMVIVGSDRTTLTGDVANKIGTYLKALAAYDNKIPFYVALPSSSIDFSVGDGVLDIPIEERSSEEVEYIEGQHNRVVERVRICARGTPVFNPGFDVTPARLVTGLITERGICRAGKEEILRLFPEICNTP